MSHQNQDYTVHVACHNGYFNSGCEYCADEYDSLFDADRRTRYGSAAVTASLITIKQIGDLCHSRNNWTS